MKTWKSFLLALAIVATGSPTAFANTVLWDWAFNIDGSLYPSESSAFGPVDASGFDSDSGIGTLSWATSGMGAHSFMSFFDYDIDSATNSWWNEKGSTQGTAAAGQSWEIDEPGYWQIYNNGSTGNIYDHLVAGNAFDNMIFDSQLDTEDVAMGMAWDFSLESNQEALITLSISEELTFDDPADISGFYLLQHDPNSNVLLSLTSTLTITTMDDDDSDDNQNPVPEPATILLFSTGLLGLARFKRKIKL